MLESRLLRPSMRAVIYSRVSTDAQERDGTSLDTQERACIEFAEENSWNITERVRETASAHMLERPGLTRVRDLLRDGFVDVIVSFAIDRLTRQQNHMGILLDDIEAAGAKFCLVTKEIFLVTTQEIDDSHPKKQLSHL